MSPSAALPGYQLVKFISRNPVTELALTNSKWNRDQFYQLFEQTGTKEEMFAYLISESLIVLKQELKYNLKNPEITNLLLFKCWPAWKTRCLKTIICT